MNEATLKAMKRLESKYADPNPKKSASFGDLTDNLIKLEGNRADFTIVAPKVDLNDMCTQSELDILGHMRDKLMKSS